MTNTQTRSLTTRNAFARLADLSFDQLAWAWGRATDGLRAAQTNRAGSLWGNRIDALCDEFDRRGVRVFAVCEPRPGEPRHYVYYADGSAE